MEKTIRSINQMVKDDVIADYAVGGAMALVFYSEPAVTFDLDVFVFLTGQTSIILNLEKIYDYCRSRGHKIEKEHIILGGIPVQFLPAYNLLVQEAVTQAVTKKVGKTPVRVVSLEHLMAIGLQTGRAKDLGRVMQLFEEKKYHVDKLEKILRQHGLLTAWRKIASKN